MSSSDSDNDELEILEKMLNKRRKVSRVQNYVEVVVPGLTSQDFKAHFRMLPGTFEYLLSIIEPILLREKTEGAPMISPRKQCLLALWRLATPDSLRQSKRQGRAMQRQIEAMVAYFERNPHVASGKFTTLHGNENLRGSWEELAQDLNMLSNKGKGKDVKSWKTTWRDLKSKVSEKIQKLRKERRMTGNNPINIKLSELDKRVLGIIGKDYVEGLCNVPDSFPEECTNAIEELRTGNESALSATPGPIIIAELNNIGTNDGAILLDDPYSIQSTSQDVLQNIEDTANMENMGDMGDMENMENIENIDTLNVTNTTSIPTQPTHRIQRSGASNPSKRRKARLSDNLNEARESFAAIAERHAEAMKMLAESMKLQAEATLQLSNNMQKLAENERRQITILENLVKRVA